MLETLDAVDWGRLSDAFGPAVEVPSLLRSLVAPDDERRFQALSRLLETVWHQGTIYEVSSHVVPFLCEMLSSPDTPDTSLPALALASLAEGTSFLEAHTLADDQARHMWKAVLAQQGRDLDEQLASERSWVRATREAVEPHIDLLLPFLAHHEPELRYAVASALKHYPKAGALSIPHLRSRLTKETEEHVTKAIEEALRTLEHQ